MWQYIEAEDPTWKNYKGRYTKLPPDGDGHFAKEEGLKERFADATPTEIFAAMFEECVELLVRETNRYAQQKNDVNFNVSDLEMKAFIGILLLSGYHRVPSQEHYWSTQTDLSVPIVSKTMPVKAFLAIKRYLHCNNNELIVEAEGDRSFKVKPFFEQLNKNFAQFGEFDRHISIDEMIVKYFGHHGLKQFIKGKHIRFGYKFWAMCGDS